MGLIILGIVAVVVFLIIVGLSTYTVVKPNQAHIVVKFGGGRRVYSPKLDDTSGDALHKTSYFFFPLVMKRIILDLTNVKMTINDIELHDKEMAPFKCDVVCWFHVDDPAKAAERLDLEHENGVFGSVLDSLQNLIQAIAREVAMKQEVLEIMRDRNTFSQSLETSVEGQIQKWGVQVVDLEINDMRDMTGSGVIANYESIRKVEIETSARKLNAQRVQEAIVVEQTNKQLAEVKTAEVEEVFRKAQISKDKNIGIAEKERVQEIAKAEQIANEQVVEAQRTLEVGQADIKAQAVVKVAEGEATAVKVKGEKAADVVTLTGKAEASVVEAKGLAEAKAKDAMAEALKKYNDAGITLEQIRAYVQVQIARSENLAKAFNAANINLTSSDPQKIFGMGIDAEGGASLASFIKTLEAVTGKSTGEIVAEVKEGVKGKGK